MISPLEVFLADRSIQAQPVCFVRTSVFVFINDSIKKFVIILKAFPVVSINA